MPSRFQEMLRVQRQNEETSRAGLMWEADEEANVLKMIFEGKTFADVAKILKRTEGSIKTRLYTILCNKIDAGEETYESVYNSYKVSSDELNEYKLKKTKREEKVMNRSLNKKQYKSTQNTSTDVQSQLNDIKRDLYLIRQYFKI
jgi:hypothetical protein